MKPIVHMHQPRPSAAVKNTAKMPAVGIHYDYQAIREAANILRNCRIETECFLACKRATVAISLAGHMTKRALVSAAGMAGAAAGSVVPVVGTFAGGYAGATAAAEWLPGYNVMPDTDPGKKIEAVAKEHFFRKYATATHYMREVRDTLVHEAGNRLINRGLEASGEAASPVGIPIMWAARTARDLGKVASTSKAEIIRELQLGLWNAEHVITTLDGGIRAAFRTRGRLRQYHDLMCMPRGPRETGVEVLDHPTNPAHWIRLSRYEKHHANALAELAIFQRFISDASIRLLAEARHTPVRTSPCVSL